MEYPKKHTVFIFIFYFISTCLHSQDDIFTGLQKQDERSGKLTIYQDINSKLLVLKNIELNRQQKGIQGYRIQIYSGTGNNARNEARQIQSRFMSLFPDIPAYMIYHEPYFKIRIGDFRNKSEGLKIKKLIHSEFPDCYFVIETEMSMPKLLP